MIRIIGKIPPKVTIACSGGIDSMVFTHFLLEESRVQKVNVPWKSSGVMSDMLFLILLKVIAS